jgi:tRNA threonylcarbamoyladenosine biosynthesis protein TsaE
MIKKSKNLKETEEIAKSFLRKLKMQKKGATIVGLYGELGTGKTTFTQHFGKYLGIKRKINSPTYVIIKNYELQIKNYKKFFHIDAYRLKNEKELLSLGWDEIISNKEHLVFIEWPENVIKALPKKHHKIYITHLSTGQAGTKEGNRNFQIKNR